MKVAKEEKVRKKLERTTGKKLFEVVWQDLLDEGLVRDYLDGTLELESDEEGWSVLVQAAERRMRIGEGVISEIQEQPAAVNGTSENPSGSETSPEEGAPPDEFLEGEDRTPPDTSSEGEKMVKAFFDYFLFTDDPKSTAMLRATSEFFGWLANHHPKVVQFRERVLGESILTFDKAQGFLGSYAARFLPLEWFTDWGIPLVGHASKIVGEYDWGEQKDELDHRVTIRVNPPGAIERLRYAHPNTPILDEDRALISTRCVLMKKSGMVMPPYDVDLPENLEEMRPASQSSPILLGNYQTPIRPSSVWPGSVIDDLYKLSEELADTFRWPGKDTTRGLGRWWRQDAAAVFVLTGVAPLMHPVDARLKLKESRYASPQWRIGLDISPWVSAEEVSRAYKRIQDQVIEGRKRLPDPKTLEVTRFVWEQERLNGYKKPPWRILFERWNKKHEEDPKAQFETYNNLCMYFTRGEKAVKEFNFDWSWSDEESLPDA